MTVILCIIKHHEYRSAAILEKLMDECKFWDSVENKRLSQPLSRDPDLRLIKTMITIAKDVETPREQSRISYMKVKNFTQYNLE